MNKQVILFTIIGILAGFGGGFFLANRINRDAAMQAQASPVQQNLPGFAANQPPFTNPNGGGGATAQVTEAIERAKNEPDNFEAQYAAANMYYQIDRFAEAVKYYESANRILPDHYQTLVRLGNSNYGLRNYTEAEKWYAQALKIKPDDVDVRTDFGTTFFLREPKDFERAIKEYRISLEKNPNHELTLQNLCAVFVEKGDMQNLQETLVRLEKVNPQNPIIPKLREEISRKS
ncbi:MAG TPA: tetratricopeptide repeat protein [Pyrinomonadaceae bacterium]|nr:tetratricopeptide repeat protein [Pyrinomonadaceae bacterium]